MASQAEERAYLVGVLGMTVDNPNISLSQLHMLARIPLEIRQLSPLFDNSGKLSDGTGLNNFADLFEQDQGSLLAVGEETISRDIVSNGGIALVSGAIGLSYFTARKTEVSTQGRIQTGTIAAAATPTLAKIGVYSVASNGDLTLAAACANDTALFAATSTNYTKSWTASFTKIAGQRYAFAHIVVSGAAIPSFARTSSALNVDTIAAPITAAQVLAQTDLAASIPNASVVGGGSRFYGVVLP
jgi:hypothetical protein